MCIFDQTSIYIEIQDLKKIKLIEFNLIVLHKIILGEEEVTLKAPCPVNSQL